MPELTAPQWLAVAGALAGLGLLLSLGFALQRRRVEARAYLRGVRYVLSDDPDAAIEALSDAARLGSPEAVETYLALGSLFRRTGDMARAVRLHRNMLLRAGLTPERRREIELELAEDYRRGGMAGDAEAAYRALWQAGERRAGEGLRDVLVDAGRLDEAVEVQQALSQGGADPVRAHLLAAVSRARSAAGDREGALAAARQAVECPGHADALLALAEAEAAAGNRAAAREAADAALSADPRAALLAWPALQALGDPAEALAVVEPRLAAAPADPALHLLRARALYRAGRSAEAADAARQALALDHTGEVTVSMREVLRETTSPAPEELPWRHELMVKALLRKVRPARCSRCGAETAVPAWRCRRCGAFGSFGPRA
ncbi:MAG: tetratricopeptide repeat protein [Deltaproteobacteria bacterium]|nr:tetratricopeptide repeat protein [Deltaproteobacteria bacterium]